MSRRGRLGIVSIALGGSALFACNALLDNDPRHLAPVPAEAGKSGAAGAGKGGDATGGNAPGDGGDNGAGVPAGGTGGDGAGQAGEGGAGTAGTAGSGVAGTAGVAGSGPSCVGECVPGTTMMDVKPCGDCGTQSRLGTCSDECQWQWGEFGVCMSTAECHPTAVNTRSAACPCGGTKGQSQTCGSDCRWGAWADTSACDLDCCTSVVYCDTPNLSGIPANRGTWCRQETAACTHAEVDADCPASVAAIDCVMHQEVYIEYL
jgi:hypothetical protein